MPRSGAAIAYAAPDTPEAQRRANLASDDLDGPVRHRDDVAVDELTAATGLHHVVDPHHPAREERLGRTPGLHEVGQLEELAELDGLVADADVGRQRALGHPPIIPAEAAGRKSPQLTSSRSTTKIRVSPGLITPPAP